MEWQVCNRGMHSCVFDARTAPSDMMAFDSSPVPCPPPTAASSVQVCHAAAAQRVRGLYSAVCMGALPGAHERGWEQRHLDVRQRQQLGAQHPHRQRRVSAVSSRCLRRRLLPGFGPGSCTSVFFFRTCMTRHNDIDLFSVLQHGRRGHQLRLCYNDKHLLCHHTPAVRVHWSASHPGCCCMEGAAAGWRVGQVSSHTRLCIRLASVSHHSGGKMTQGADGHHGLWAASSSNVRISK